MVQQDREDWFTRSGADLPVTSYKGSTTSPGRETGSYEHLKGKLQPAHLGSQSQAPGKEGD